LGGGDFNFDGYDDIVSAAAAEDYDELERVGCIYMIMGTASLPEGTASVGWAADMQICATVEQQRLGRHAIPQLIDVDGDLSLDMVVGAPGADYAGTDASGEVYVFFNDGDLAGTLTTDDADVTINGAGAARAFGYALHSGDFDGDGDFEISIGAPDTMDYDDDLDEPGEVFIFRTATLASGGDFTWSDADLQMNGDGDTQFGSSMSSADFDGDGSEELIISSPRWDDEKGRISVFSLD
jgi:hypothetical protein